MCSVSAQTTSKRYRAECTNSLNYIYSCVRSQGATQWVGVFKNNTFLFALFPRRLMGPRQARQVIMRQARVLKHVSVLAKNVSR